MTGSDCEICRPLKNLETSFYKFGRLEMDRPLPVPAHRYLAAEYVLDYGSR